MQQVPPYRTPAWSIPSIGDSLTDKNNGFPYGGNMTWPSILQRRLRAVGCRVASRNLGTSGNTTTQMLARLDAVLNTDYRPAWLSVFGGANDPGNGIAQATTQLNIEAMIMAAKFGAYALLPGMGPSYNTMSYATPSVLPAGGQVGQRAVVLSDNDTTGGASADPVLAAQNGASFVLSYPGLETLPTISGTAAGSPVAAWECRNPLAGVLGWGRVGLPQTPHGNAPTSGATVSQAAMVAPWHVRKFVVVGMHYLNYTTGGDTPATPYASYAPVRVAQQAAVTAQNVNDASANARVVYADVYNYMRDRIVGGTIYGQTFALGTDPNFSADTSIVPTTSYDQTKSWHIAQNNQHFSAYGQRLVAQAIMAAIPAAWLNDLQ